MVAVMRSSVTLYIITVKKEYNVPQIRCRHNCRKYTLSDHDVSIQSPTIGNAVLVDRGIDQVYSEFFGWGMSEHLRRVIHVEYGGELPVGTAITLDIRRSNKDASIPYLICAPTMRVPMNVAHTVNAYLAFRAALRAAIKEVVDYRQVIKSILCPGLGTAVGEMPYMVCAMQMHAAYRDIFDRRNLAPVDVLGIAHARHYMMLNVEAYDMKLQAGQ